MDETDKELRQLDFIICGIPRSGTTLFGEVLNGHENIYCYFAESNLFYWLMMFAENTPFPKENLSLLKSILMSYIRSDIIDKIQNKDFLEDIKYYTNLLGEQENGLGYKLIDNNYLEKFVNVIIELFCKGLFGKELLKAGTDLLANTISNKTKRKVLGEKTPDNVKVVHWLLENNCNLQVYSLVREPFHTIASMRQRADRSMSSWDKGFSNSFYASMGMYLKYFRDIHQINNNYRLGHCHLIRFEDFVDRPTLYLENILQILQLPFTQKSMLFAQELVHSRKLSHPDDLGFSEVEISILQVVLGQAMSTLGYTSDFYKERGNKLKCWHINDHQLVEQIIPLYGFYLENEKIINCWMQQEASLFLISINSRQILKINLWNSHFSEIVPLVLEIYCNDLLITQHNLKVGEDNIALRLSDLLPSQLSNSFKGFSIRLKASSSFRPITIIGMGPDVRELAVFIKDIKFE